MATDFLQRAFTVDFLFQPAQRLFNRLAFFELNFRQNYFTSFPVCCPGFGWRTASPVRVRERHSSERRVPVNRQNLPKQAADMVSASCDQADYRMSGELSLTPLLPA